MDLMLGTEVCRKVRELEKTDASRVRAVIILCTATAGGQLKVTEFDLDAMWSKPFPPVHDGSMQRQLADIFSRAGRGNVMYS